MSANDRFRDSSSAADDRPRLGALSFDDSISALACDKIDDSQDLIVLVMGKALDTFVVCALAVVACSCDRCCPWMMWVKAAKVKVALSR